MVLSPGRLRLPAPGLLVGLATTLLAWFFIWLGSEMAEGDTRAFDIVILCAKQAPRDSHPGLAAVMCDLSGLCSTVVMALYTLVAVGHPALISARRVAGLVGITGTTRAAGITLLKSLFSRSRPDTAIGELVAAGRRFPRGPAGLSAIAFLALLDGLSRVALGVHQASEACWQVGPMASPGRWSVCG